MLDRLKDILAKFARRGIADKEAVEELVKELQRILIQADVDVKLVADLTKRIKDKALVEQIPKGLTRREHVVDIVYKELVRFLGEKKAEVKLGKQNILLLGLYGAGKTTFAIKIARFFQKRGLNVGVIGADIWRPAALEQLQQLGKQANIEVYGEKNEKDPVKILKKGLEHFKGKKDVIIVDSAGRSALDAKLSEEIKKINEILKAEEKLLVVSGDIGQAAGKQATEFNKLVGLTGVIVTKMDSSAKGGGALSTCAAAGVPVKFIGVGEKIDDLELYDPVRFTSRILGMGDLQALLEKAQAAITPEKAKEIITGEFTLLDFYEQIAAMQKMGSMDKVLDMIPGFGAIGAKVPKEMLGVQEEKMKKWKFIIDSMTPQEKTNPDVLDSSRMQRIAKGSGTKPEEVRELLKSYRMVKKMMKKLKPGAIKRGQLGKMFKGFKGMGF